MAATGRVHSERNQPYWQWQALACGRPWFQGDLKGTVTVLLQWRGSCLL